MIKKMRGLYSVLLFSAIAIYNISSYKIYPPILPSQHKYPLSKKAYLEYLDRIKKNTNPLNLKNSPPYLNRTLIYDDDDDNDDDVDFEY
jgi:hypothetical protein